MSLSIKISQIDVVPIRPQAGLLAFTSFVINDAFFCGDIAIHGRPNGDLRLVFPRKILFNGKQINIFYPVSKSAGELVLREVSKKYQQITGGNFK